MAKFNRRSLEEYTDSLAAYVPGGRLFAAKGIEGTTFRKLLRGLAGELFRVNGLIKEYAEQIIPDKTVKFVTEWERSLGIPDDCFKGSGTIDERRRDVLVKLASLGVQTIADFEAIALIFGVVVQVVPGSASGIIFASKKIERFTIVINITLPEAFPYTFPITFGDDTTVLLECLFKKLKPANCQVLFQGI